MRYQHLLGVPFKHLGRDPEVGLDCLGVVLAVYAEAGIDMGLPKSLSYERDFAEAEDLFAENLPRQFVEIPEPDRELDLAFVNRRDRPFAQHVVVMIDAEHCLDVRPRVGVHTQRFSVYRRFFRYACRWKGEAA